jgi:hypothetical protein
MSKEARRCFKNNRSSVSKVAGFRESAGQNYVTRATRLINWGESRAEDAHAHPDPTEGAERET